MIGGNSHTSYVHTTTNKTLPYHNYGTFIIENVTFNQDENHTMKQWNSSCDRVL